jgi:hypothetical protein
MKRIFRPADILIPDGTDMTAWSVVACDQFTSEPEYWEKAEKIAGCRPSTADDAAGSVPGQSRM